MDPNVQRTSSQSPLIDPKSESGDSDPIGPATGTTTADGTTADGVASGVGTGVGSGVGTGVGTSGARSPADDSGGDVVSGGAV